MEDTKKRLAVFVGFNIILDIKRDLIDEGAYEQEINGHTEYLRGIDFAIDVIKKHLNKVYGAHISEPNNLWMNEIFDKDQINAKTEQWTKEAEKAGMTLPEYLESISPLNNKESEVKE